MRENQRTVTILDWVVLCLILFFVGYVVYRLFFSLNYKWHWEIIPIYLLKFESETQRWTANILLEGFFITIKLSIWGTVFALVIGFFMGASRISPRLFFKLCGRTYIETIRNTPPLVLIFIFYYFVSDQVLTFLGVEAAFRASSDNVRDYLTFFFASPDLITQFLSGVLTLSLFQGAYIAEIFRAGIEAIVPGQWEAGKALGLSRWKVLRLIIFPQAMRIMLPPLANEFINTIKWSSIVAIISIQELTFQGIQVMASTQATIEVWLTISLMYLILCFSLSLGVQKLEKHLNRANEPSPPPHRIRW